MFKRISNRLLKFDYSSPNYYFLTTCTEGKRNFFGEVVNGKMQLNGLGLIAEKFWKDIPNHYKGVSLDVFIVMPNHVHGIVIIEPVEADTGRQYQMEAGSLRYGSLPKIIGAFKSITSKAIHEAGLNDFSWQKSFYDHVIRKEESLDKIREYILNNPLKWELDRNNPENLWM